MTLVIGLMSFLVPMALLWPRAIVIGDEALYVSQAVAFARGALTIPGAETLWSASGAAVASNYPPGTSLLQTPFVALAGWRGAFALGPIALVVATLATAAWIRRAGLLPQFAIAVPAFLPTLVLARTAMSDVPGAAVVALALLGIARSDESRMAGFAGGLAAAATLLFRETSALLVLPFAASALARSPRRALPLGVGIGVGLAARLLIASAMFGDPFYVRPSGYGFSAAAVGHNLPVYALALLVLLPAAALLVPFYRGAWRGQILAALTLYFLVLLTYEYDALTESGPVGVLLLSRFVIPAVPLLALVYADVLPRLAGSGLRSGRARPLAIAVTLWTMAGALVVHGALRRVEARQLAFIDALQKYTIPSRPLIINHLAAAKYLIPAYGPRHLVPRAALQVGDVISLVGRDGMVQVAFVERRHTELFARDAAENEAFLEKVRSRCVVVPVHEMPRNGGVDLRILQILSCRS